MTQTLQLLAPRSIEELMMMDVHNAQRITGELLQFKFPTAQEHDVYNITAPFNYNGCETIAGRIEQRNDEVNTQIGFFQEVGDEWVHVESLPTLPLQDPFVCTIWGQLIVGGVRVYPIEDSPTEVKSWETHIYAGDDLKNLDLKVVGPRKMKDIRLVEIENEIGVFTRPQGEKGGRGKIGFVTVPSLDYITPELLDDAPIIPGIFIDDEWGGVNEAHILDDGRIGVVGHIARYNELQGREYYPMTFVFDPYSHEINQQQIIASRDWFPPTESKKPDTEKVLFSGGMRFLGNTAVLYCGISDTCAGKVTVPNPFM